MRHALKFRRVAKMIRSHLPGDHQIMPDTVAAWLNHDAQAFVLDLVGIRIGDLEPWDPEKQRALPNYVTIKLLPRALPTTTSPSLSVSINIQWLYAITSAHLRLFKLAPAHTAAMLIAILQAQIWKLRQIHLKHMEEDQA